jgi:hypothetical protein
MRLPLGVSRWLLHSLASGHEGRFRRFLVVALFATEITSLYTEFSNWKSETPVWLIDELK